jgi:hypothetical protein
MSRVLLVSLLLHPAFSLERESGLICVAPLPQSIDGRQAAGGLSVRCAAEKYSFKIDAQSPLSWPQKESLKIDDLNVAGPHRVAVLCGGKPMQSFTFRFSDFSNRKLCLFLNDLYWTAQLWETKRSPWCHCK